MKIGLLFALNALANLLLLLALQFVLPSEAFGEVTLWFAVGTLGMAAFFDWVRNTSFRFLTATARAGEPDVRATLDKSFAAMLPPSILVVVPAVLLFQPGAGFGFALIVAALIITVSANEYLGAVARLNRDIKTYALMTSLRHGLVFPATLLAGWATGSPLYTLLAYVAAALPALLLGFLLQRPSLKGRFSMAMARRFAAYGVPLIIADALFQLPVAANRYVLGETISYAEVAAYALAFDLVLKVLGVLASVYDVMFFPALVDRHEAEADKRLHEAEAGATSREAAARYAARLLALITPAAVGFALLAEPIAELIIKPDLRADFVSIIWFTSAAAWLYTVQTYGLKPMFLLGKASLPMVAIAFAGCAAMAAALAMMAMTLKLIAIWHMAALGIGLGVGILLAMRRGTASAPWRDIALITAATLAMAGAVVGAAHLWPRGAIFIGPLSGSAVYLGACWLFDIAGCRAPLRDFYARTAR
jgi:O-antigen/teichoic acid export membrane protein